MTPEVALARSAGVALGTTGAIAVDDRLATNVPHIWAAGDCIEVRRLPDGRPLHLPLGSLANRQGRVLADVLAGRDDRFPGATGAVAVKVFDLNVAATGLTRTRAEAEGIAARSVWVTAHDRAHYWPEAAEIAIHLVYEAGSRRVLGVQAVGAGEVAKRVDVATAYIARGATVTELAGLEHAYAPPFAPAIDPLAAAAFAAENQEDGLEARRPGRALRRRPRARRAAPRRARETPAGRGHRDTLWRSCGPRSRFRAATPGWRCASAGPAPPRPRGWCAPPAARQATSAVGCSCGR